MILLDLVVPGDPVAKGRPRVGRGRAYTPARTAEAEERLRGLVDVAMLGQEPYTGPVGLAARFYLATARKADGDNLLKLVADCVQRGRRTHGGVIVDDGQIEEWWCRVHRRAPNERPRTEVVLYALDDQELLAP